MSTPYCVTITPLRRVKSRKEMGIYSSLVPKSRNCRVNEERMQTDNISIYIDCTDREWCSRQFYFSSNHFTVRDQAKLSMMTC